MNIIDVRRVLTKKKMLSCMDDCMTLTDVAVMIGCTTEQVRYREEELDLKIKRTTDRRAAWQTSAEFRHRRGISENGLKLAQGAW